MKRIATVFLASILAFSLAFSPVLAYAADIDFDNPDGSGASGYTIDKNNIISTDHATNTLTGNGANYGLHFDDKNAQVTINGNVVVGGGIVADGNLELVGTTEDSLAVSYENENDERNSAVDVEGTLSISNGLTVTVESNTPWVSSGISAKEFVLNEGTVDARGSSSNDNEPSIGIEADSFSIGGTVYSQESFNQQYPTNVTTTISQRGTVFLQVLKEKDVDNKSTHTTEAELQNSAYEQLVALGIMPAGLDLQDTVCLGEFARYLYIILNGGVDDGAVAAGSGAQSAGSPYENYIKALVSARILKENASQLDPLASFSTSEMELAILKLLTDYDSRPFLDARYDVVSWNLPVSVDFLQLGLAEGISDMSSGTLTYGMLAQILVNALNTSTFTVKITLYEIVPTGTTLYDTYFTKQ